MNEEERIALRFIQISDLHITEYGNLLEPMIDQINREVVDLVVVTGDVVQSPKKELFNIAMESLNKINHRVIVIPGDYDGGDLWVENFGERFKSVTLNGYCLDFLDTSFLRHRFAAGWGDVIEEEDPDQYKWLEEQLKIDKYHFVFSHHPFWVQVGDQKKKHKLLKDNVRAIYSGHLHELGKFYFEYDHPRRHFQNGVATVPMRFHGNSCYLVVFVKNNDEIINIPRSVIMKRTAW